jgi:hypothetical protein
MLFQQFAFSPFGTSSSGYPSLVASIQVSSKAMRNVLKCLSINVVAIMLVIPVSLSLGQTQAGFAAEPAPASDTPSKAAHREDYDPLLDLPPLPHNEVTLIGGVVVSLDEVMNRLVLQPFGTKQKLQVRFDTRTHFYRNGKQITEREVKQGQRVYLDTMLNRDQVFAKTIWIRTTAENGVGRGQIMEFDPQRETVTVRDELSNQPLRLQLTPTTSVRKGNTPGSRNDLVQGALVSIEFSAQQQLREITILATPGSTFTFAGRVTYIDLSRKLIAIDNRSDGKKYDVYTDAIAPNVLRQLREGAEITISAVFDGDRYSARSVGIPGANSAQQNP